MNLKLNCIHVNGKQDKSDENRSKCPVDGSMFPHPWLDEVIKCPCEYYIHQLIQFIMYMFFVTCILRDEVIKMLKLSSILYTSLHHVHVLYIQYMYMYMYMYCIYSTSVTCILIDEVIFMILRKINIPFRILFINEIS